MGSSSSLRVVRRSTQQSRCVYCHDLVGGKDAPCARCGAFLHVDCRAQLTRCPTIGCAEPLLRTAVALRRPVPAHEPLTGGAGLRDGARPGGRARSGPYARLLLSALLNLVLVGAVIGGGVAALLASPWSVAGGLGLIPVTAAGLFGLLVASASVRWLLRLPRVFRDVGRLLDQSRPTSMVLDVVSARDGESRRWEAQLRRTHDSPPVCALPLRGLLVPRWLRRPLGGQRVWVWGWPGSPGGPYLLELPGGRLALLHP